MVIADILENEKKTTKRIKFKPPLILKTRGCEHFSVPIFKYLVIFSLLSFLPSSSPFVFVLLIFNFVKMFYFAHYLPMWHAGSVPQPGIQPGPLALEAWSLSPWTTRDIPPLSFFKLKDACVHAKSLLSCLTLCNPVDCSPLGFLVHGIIQARSGLPCPPPGDLPDPGIKPMSLMSPALSGGFFSTIASATWEAQIEV